MIRRIKTYGSGQYIEYVPQNPIGIILSLHGLGEVASKGPVTIVENNEIPKQLKKQDPNTGVITNPLGFEAPYIVVAPQMGGSSWYRAIMRNCFSIIDALADEYELTEKHCTGISLGGMGTVTAVNHAYEWNGNKPGYFKSYGIICGKSTTTPAVEKFAGSVVRWWHGLADPTITFKSSQAEFFIDTLKANGIDATLKTYDGVKHNSWVNAYHITDPESYWKWLESKRVIPVQPPADEPATLVVADGQLYAITDSTRYKVNATITPQ